MLQLQEQWERPHKRALQLADEMAAIARQAGGVSHVVLSMGEQLGAVVRLNLSPALLPMLDAALQVLRASPPPDAARSGLD